MFCIKNLINIYYKMFCFIRFVIWHDLYIDWKHCGVLIISIWSYLDLYHFYYNLKRLRYLMINKSKLHNFTTSFKQLQRLIDHFLLLTVKNEEEDDNNFQGILLACSIKGTVYLQTIIATLPARQVTQN